MSERTDAASGASKATGGDASGSNANSGTTYPSALAQMTFEYGTNATQRDNFLAILYNYQSLSQPALTGANPAGLKEVEVAALLGMMAMTYSSLEVAALSAKAGQMQLGRGAGSHPHAAQPDTWLYLDFFAMLRDMCPHIKWPVVIQCLDYPEFYIHDVKSVEVIVKSFDEAVKSTVEFPIHVFCKAWQNISGQLSFIRNALLAPLELVMFSKTRRKIISREELDAQTASPSYSILHLLFSQNWNSMDLMEFICSIVDTEYFDEVRPVFELASKQCPELLCLGLAQFNPPWNSILKEILGKLACGFLAGQPSSPIVLPRLWRINSPVFLACMIDMHRRDATCISRLLDVAQEVKILGKILEAKPYSFSIDMACLASRREHLNLEKWLQDNIREHRDPFIRAVIDFLSEKYYLHCQRMAEASTGNASRSFVPSSIPLPPDTILLVSKLLTIHQNLMSFESLEVFRELQNHIASDPTLTGASVQGGPLASMPAAPSHMGHAPVSGANPTLSATVQPLTHLAAAGAGNSKADDYSLPQFTSYFETTYPTDIEDEANSFYEKIYSQEASVQDVLETMTQLRLSRAPRDAQIFACMIHNLLDEYRFFAKYPEKELYLTGVIFGQLVQTQLIQQTPLGIALRFILDALKKGGGPGEEASSSSGGGGKMYRFGLIALIQFLPRLYEWPQYCQHLLQMEAAIVAPFPDLATYIRSSLSYATMSASNPHLAATLRPVLPAQPSYLAYLHQTAGPYLSLILLQQQQQQHGSGASTGTSTPGQQQRSTPSAMAPMMLPNTVLAREHTAPSSDAAAIVHEEIVPMPGATFTCLARIKGFESEYDALWGQPGAAAASSAEETAIAAGVMPSEAVQDRALFCLNNMTAANVTAKAADLGPLLFTPSMTQSSSADGPAPGTLLWFSQYLVSKRIAIEPNYHAVYLQLIDQLNASHLAPKDASASQTADTETETGESGAPDRAHSVLSRSILLETVSHIRRLLVSDKTLGSSNERTLLKNLGLWLGTITLGRNQPILHHHLPLRDLLIEGHALGRLIVVMPFVCKVLEGCRGSRVFGRVTSNPWVFTLLGLLADLYALPTLKLNLKFEMEVLCKHLQVELRDIQAATHRATTGRRHRLPAATLSSASVAATASAAAAAKVNKPLSTTAHAHNGLPGTQSVAMAPVSGNTGILPLASQQQQQQQQLHQHPLALLDALTSQTMPGLLEHLVFTPGAAQGGASSVNSPMITSPSSTSPTAGSTGASGATAAGGQALQLHPLLVSHPLFKRMVLLAVEFAIREVSAAVIDRSVSIACLTTREMINKDFMGEPDEERMKKAAQQMMQHLTGNLILGTAKDPMRNALVANLSAFGVYAGLETWLPEDVLHRLAEDNLEMACAFVEKAAIEKAIPEINNALAASYALRRQFRQGRVSGAGSSAPFRDEAYEGPYRHVMTQLSSPLPAALLPLRTEASSEEGLRPEQVRLYDDFIRLSRLQNLAALPVVSIPPLGPDEYDRASLALKQAAALSQKDLSAGLGLAASAAAPTQAGYPLVGSGGSGALQAPVPIPSALHGQPQQSQHPLTSTMDQFMLFLYNIERLVLATAQNHIASGSNTVASLSFSALPPNHELRTLMKQVLVLALNSPNRDEICLLMSQKILHILYRLHENAAAAQQQQQQQQPASGVMMAAAVALGIEVHVVLLDKLCELSIRVTREVTAWVIYAPPDERKLNVSVTVSFLLSGLVNVLEYDLQLAKCLSAAMDAARSDASPSVDSSTSVPLVPLVAYAVGLVKRCVLGDPVITSPYEFSATLDVLASRLPPLMQELSQQRIGQSLQTIQPSLSQVIRDVTARRRTLESESAEAMQEHVAYYWHEWLRVSQMLSAADKAFSSFTHQVYRQGFFRSARLLRRFFTLTLRLVLEETTAMALAPLKTAADTPAPDAEAELARKKKSEEKTRKEQQMMLLESYAKWITFILRCYPSACKLDAAREESDALEGASEGDILECGKSQLLDEFLAVVGEALLASSTAPAASSSPAAAMRLPLITKLLTCLLSEWNSQERHFTSAASSGSSDGAAAGSGGPGLLVTHLLPAFGDFLHAVRPELLPAFAFGWLELVSHRFFLPKLLILRDKEKEAMAMTPTPVAPLGWSLMHQLIQDQLAFLGPQLTTGTGSGGPMSEAVQLYYRGTLRVFLLLLHDFPEFLAAFYVSLVGLIPAACVQLKNLVLAAFPRHLKLLDPFTPNLKMDALPESAALPAPLFVDVETPLKIVLLPGTDAASGAATGETVHAKLLTFLDVLEGIQKEGRAKGGGYGGSAQQLIDSVIEPFVQMTLLPLFTLDATAAQTKRYNVPLINYFSLFMVHRAANGLRREMEAQQPSATTTLAGLITAHPFSSLFLRLCLALDAEGRYHLLGALANHLRFPNSHTHYVSCLMLHLFAATPLELVREQITRVLLERLIVNRPHPWGLLITFIELIKNAQYNFWNHSFTRFAPDIERLFDSVARSCMLPRTAPAAAVSSQAAPPSAALGASSGTSSPNH